jgi:hypothetical protein
MAVLALVMLPACVPEFDDDLSRVTEPRIIAIRATPAEAKPGEAVALSALVAGGNEGAAPRWLTCVERKPLTELGPVSSECARWQSAAADALVDLGSGSSVTATVPADACRLFGPTRPEPKPGEPAGRPVDPDPTGGWYQPFAVGLPDSNASAVGAVRLSCPLPGVTPAQSVEFTERYRRNENPAFESLSVAGTATNPGAATRVPRGATVALSAAWPACPSTSTCGDGICGELEDRGNCADDCTEPRGCAGGETYAWFDPESRRIVARQETMRVSWFATAGQFAEERTGRAETEATVSSVDNAWTAPAEPQNVSMWLVIRDDRGGQSWTELTIEVE